MRVQVRRRPSPSPGPSSTPRIPMDKQQKQGTHSKPFTPALSSNFRNTKNPLTPRLAGSGQATTVAVPRRGVQTPATPVPHVHSRNAHVTPTASPLNLNITPRSGARQSRAHESPSAGLDKPLPPKPPSRPASTVSTGGHPVYNIQGLGISGQQSQDSIESPRFFHADDAKSSVSASETEERPKPLQKKNTFFYASGNPESLKEATTSTPHLPSTRNDPNRYQNVVQRRVSGASRSPPSGTSSPSLTPQDAPKSALLRPHSPLKDSNSLQRQGLPQGANPIQNVSALVPTPASRVTVPIPKQRKPSLGKTINVPLPPGKRASIGSTSRKSSGPEEKTTQPGTGISTPTSFISPQITPVSPPTSTSIETLLLEQKRQSWTLAAELENVPGCPMKQDDTASNHLQKVNELAANARRERKVLDLEISNSSLLAINRTLERELRKQSAELRRFRRLSRAGQLSALAGSTRSVSGQSALSTLAESEDEQESDMEEPLESDGDEDFESSFEDSDVSGLSPGAQAERDARQRARDEKRLQLDLSKHQELLVDSQKMTQSIRRCLTWTDELISEGKKALEYQVRVSDIELGGRVLSHEDEGVETRKGLLSPSATVESFDQMWAEKLNSILELASEGNEPAIEFAVTEAEARAEAFDGS